MAVGRPVVATRVGGTPEIVEDGVTGHLVPARDPDALATAIVDMCRERDRWPSMGRQARKNVEQNFSIREMLSQYETCYRELLVAKRKRGAD